MDMDASSTTHARRPYRPRGSVFTRYALHALLKNRNRTLVAIAGIALSCALVTAIFTTVATLYSGLIQTEAAHQGTWQVEFDDASDQTIERIQADPRIEKSYVRETYGSALMPESFEGYWGRYILLQEWLDESNVEGLSALPTIASGRAPLRAGEIVLPADLEGVDTQKGPWLFEPLANNEKDAATPRATWVDGLQIGSTIELTLGQRYTQSEQDDKPIKLNPDDSLYTYSGIDGDTVIEYLDDIDATRAYTVVGFFETGDTIPSGNAVGYQGFIAANSLPPRCKSIIAATNCTTFEQIQQLVGEYTASKSGGGAQIHDTLLSLQGMHADSSIWNSLYLAAFDLVAIVVIASVSLIYNSFAISISERTRQFGLLASLGASKRQIRRTVWAEALALSLAGIPIGLILGVAGTWAAFEVAGEGIGLAIDPELFGTAGLRTIVIEPTILAACAALALATVLASAAVPAFRASRSSAIDAIKQRGDLGEGKTHRFLRRSAIARRADAVRIKLFGVSGMMAHRNLTRASGRGRVAVASLAVSAALIILSGGIDHYLGFLSSAAYDGTSDIEVQVGRALNQDETTADGIRAVEGLYGDLKSLPGVKGEGIVFVSNVYAQLDSGMLDPKCTDSETEEYLPFLEGKALSSDGDAYLPVMLIFADRPTWNDIVASNKLGRISLGDAEHPVALALNATQSFDGEDRIVRNLFRDTGTVELFTHIDCPEKSILTTIEVDPQGEPVAGYDVYDEEQGEYADAIAYSALEKAVLASYDLSVGGIITDYPQSIGNFATDWPSLLLPLDTLPTLAADSESIVPDRFSGSMAAPLAFHPGTDLLENSMGMYLSFAAEEPVPAQRGMEEILSKTRTQSEWRHNWLTNNAENARQERVIAESIELFLDCFVIVTCAIAMANVFNTLANSIILRKREFAMLMSMGMEKRSFLRMIALECLSYAWRGLVFGIALGAAATFLIYQTMSISFKGIEFALMFEWVIGAAIAVGGVLALSVGYALKRAESTSIIATLREDSI